MSEHVYESDFNFELKSNWYDDDLQLAAELGKNLLERNQALELQLQQAISTQDDQKLEIDLLQRQIEILKNVNDSRMRMYEDVDRNAQELEVLNAQLLNERKLDKESIVNLKESVKKLEEKNNELNEMIEENATTKVKQKSPNNFVKKRVSSVPRLYEPDRRNDSSMNTFCRREEIIDQLQIALNREMKTTKRLEMQLTIEKNKRKLLENDLNNSLSVHAVTEQRFIEEINKLKNLLMSKNNSKLYDEMGNNNYCEDHDEKSRKISIRPSQLATTTSSSKPPLPPSSPSTTSTTNSEAKVEHDLDKLPRGKVVRLKNGGSAYGSKESLHMIGLEVADEDATPSVEICSTILASDIPIRVREQKSREQREAASFSLLAELEEQYQKLVQRYETLIESKQKSNLTDRSTQDNLDSSSCSNNHHSNKSSASNNSSSSNKLMSMSIDLKSPIDPTDSHFDHGPPEYKRLFKEIFQTLRRSMTYDDDSA